MKMWKLVNTGLKNNSLRTFVTGKFARQEFKENSLVKKTEDTLNYPISSLGLDGLLTDEITNHLSHVIETKYSVLGTIKTFNSVLIVSSVAKMAGSISDCADILEGQKILAKLSLMIKLGHSFHNKIVNVPNSASDDLHFNNKIALLSGDYILSTSFAELAKLKQFDVQEIMSSSLRDLVEADYIGKRGPQNQAIPSMPNSQQTDIEVPNEYDTQLMPFKNVLGNMKMEWTLRTILGGGTLLGKACQCSLIFGNHEKAMQEAAYRFGRDLAIAWQASLDKEVIMEDSFSLVAAPVMCHLEHNSEFYNTIEEMTSSGWDVDYDLIRKAVLSGPGIEQTLEFQKIYTNKALKTLDLFENSDSKQVLINLINSF